MTTYTYQPDDTTGLDTFIYSAAPTTNYSTDTNIGCGDDGTGDYRTLLKFDISDIPSSYQVTSATLTLTVSYDASANARTLSVYRQLKDWVEAQATWNIYKTSNNWTTAGGFNAADCEQTAIGTVTQPASPALNSTLSITLNSAKVQEWISGATTNNGMLLKVDTESGDFIAYYSSSGLTASRRPKLVIEAIPSVGGCAFTCVL